MQIPCFIFAEIFKWHKLCPWLMSLKLRIIIKNQIKFSEIHANLPMESFNEFFKRMLLTLNLNTVNIFSFFSLQIKTLNSWAWWRILKTRLEEGIFNKPSRFYFFITFFFIWVFSAFSCSCVHVFSCCRSLVEGKQTKG